MDELSCDDVSCFCKDSGELHIVLDVGDSRSVADSRGNGLRQLDSGYAAEDDFHPARGSLNANM